MGRSSDKMILIALPMLALIAAVYLLVISPKREEASKLGAQVSALETAVSEQEALALAAETARESFSENYARMVTLGEAVPADSEQSSLLVVLDAIASKTEVSLSGLTLDAGSSDVPPPPPPAPAQTPAATAAQDEAKVEAAEAGDAAVPAPVDPATGLPAATEASAALAPFGSTIGPAGLPLNKYEISLSGKYFAIADFLASLDALVSIDEKDGLAVNGRLVTIDRFALSSDGGPSGELSAEISLTAYLTPADQGTTLGATASGPALTGTETETVAPPPAAPVATVPTP